MNSWSHHEISVATLLFPRCKTQNQTDGTMNEVDMLICISIDNNLMKNQRRDVFKKSAIKYIFVSFPRISEYNPPMRWGIVQTRASTEQSDSSIPVFPARHRVKKKILNYKERGDTYWSSMIHESRRDSSAIHVPSESRFEFADSKDLFYSKDDVRYISFIARRDTPSHEVIVEIKIIRIKNLNV